MALTETLTDLGMKTANVVHRGLISLSGGRIGGSIGGMEVYALTTTGRVSGQPRTVMLTAPLERDETLVFVASKGGDDRHPDWYRNLVAEPTVTVTDAGGGEPRSMVARTASADEKAELWPEIVAASKNYAGYAGKTERDIPVVLVEPAGS